MRAAVLHGKEDVRIETVDQSPLNSGEVRVQIEAAITCGTDLKVFRRGYHARMIVPPAVFGHEMAGIVSEVHSMTNGWKVGERVVIANSAPCGLCFYCKGHQENLCDDLHFLNGAYAESIVVPSRFVEKNLLRLRPATSFVNAALTEPLACVVQGLIDLKPLPGESALILGSGPIGLMFAALLVKHGVSVRLVGRGKNRLALARKLNCAQVIDIEGETNLVHRIQAESLRPPDLVVEAVGKPETWNLAVQVVRKGGRVNLFGGCPSGTCIEVDTGLIHYSNLTLLASFHHTPHSIRTALGHIEDGDVSASDFVDGIVGLSELPALFASLMGGNRFVKSLVEVKR